MVKVFFGTGCHSSPVAVFEDEELYIACIGTLKAEAMKSGMTVTETVEDNISLETLL